MASFRKTSRIETMALLLIRLTQSQFTKRTQFKSVSPVVQPLASFLRYFLQSHAYASAILVDELDSRTFKTPLHHLKCGSTRFMKAGFQLTHRYDPYARFLREFLLTPIKEPAGSSALCWTDHVPGGFALNR
jgi:hypothetical protein